MATDCLPPFPSIQSRAGRKGWSAPASADGKGRAGISAPTPPAHVPAETRWAGRKRWPAELAQPAKHAAQATAADDDGRRPTGRPRHGRRRWEGRRRRRREGHGSKSATGRRRGGYGRARHDAPSAGHGRWSAARLSPTAAAARSGGPGDGTRASPPASARRARRHAAGESVPWCSSRDTTSPLRFLSTLFFFFVLCCVRGRYVVRYLLVLKCFFLQAITFTVYL